MRKVFIDCGTNLCQGLKEIYDLEQMNENWIIYSFEVNPFILNIIDKNKYPNVKFINEGVWISNDYRNLNIEVLKGQLKEYLNESPIFNVSEENRLVIDANVGGATNIMDNLNYIHGVSDNMIVFEKQVKCFDFSEFVKNNFTREDFIVIKFDIEGDEFPVIEKMISENTIDLVDVLYVEWHDFAMQMSSTSLVNQILSKGIKLNSWR